MIYPKKLFKKVNMKLAEKLFIYPLFRLLYLHKSLFFSNGNIRFGGPVERCSRRLILTQKICFLYFTAKTTLHRGATARYQSWFHLQSTSTIKV